MTDSSAIDVLNELRLAELGSLLPRLAEAAVFVDSRIAADYAEVQRMIQEQAERVRLLEDTILALDGNLAPGCGDIALADVHYVELRVLLPRVLEDQRRLAETCRSAASRLPGSPSAVAAANKLAELHAANAIRLNQIADGQRSVATQP